MDTHAFVDAHRSAIAIHVLKANRLYLMSIIISSCMDEMSISKSLRVWMEWWNTVSARMNSTSKMFAEKKKQFW